MLPSVIFDFGNIGTDQWAILYLFISKNKIQSKSIELNESENEYKYENFQV